MTMFCLNCGSQDVDLRQGESTTGVVAPDGAEEVWYESFYQCLNCGAKNQDIAEEEE
jgi:Zn finger protein HypA/HybF involved in hydrogenase expression